MTDFSRMNLSELIRFAEEQAGIERERPQTQDKYPSATWADTLSALRYMEQHGLPDARKGGYKPE